MERVKKRKMKFSCLFGANDESPRLRFVQSRSPASPVTEQSLFKFEVGKSTSKRRNKNRMKKLFAKGISAKKRSPSIISKLMRRGGLFSKNVVSVDYTSNRCKKNTEPFGSVTDSKRRDAKETGPGISSEVKEGFGSGYVTFGDENSHVLRSGFFSESEEITVSFRIIFDQHDRLTHSLSCTSESSLIREATNRMLERLNTIQTREDVGSVSKVSIGDGHIISASRSTSLSSASSDPVYESNNVCHEDVIDEAVNDEDHVSISDTDVDAQLSGPESEDEAFHSDCFESINSRLQDLKKNLQRLKVGSKLTSNRLTLIPRVRHIGQQSPVAIPESVSRESAYITYILQTLEKYADEPDTTTPSGRSETTDHPIDPWLFYCLEKYYFEGTILLSNEKRLFYDYIEQMYVRTSKSAVAYPWVNPMQRESQLRFPRLSFADQIRNVVDEIEKEENEDFFAIYIDKDLEWVQATNEIDMLGKLIADLVLHDLLFEVLDS